MLTLDVSKYLLCDSILLCLLLLNSIHLYTHLHPRQKLEHLLCLQNFAIALMSRLTLYPHYHLSRPCCSKLESVTSDTLLDANENERGLEKEACQKMHMELLQVSKARKIKASNKTKVSELETPEEVR